MLDFMFNVNRFWVLNVYFYHKFLNSQETAACFKSCAAAPAASAASAADSFPQRQNKRTVFAYNFFVDKN